MFWINNILFKVDSDMQYSQVKPQEHCPETALSSIKQNNILNGFTLNISATYEWRWTESLRVICII